MQNVFRLSEAGALALHAAVYLAAYPDRSFTARELTVALSGSNAHLVKVLQRLARVGLVASERGPHGGYTLTMPAKRITIRRVIEAIEGPMTGNACLLKHPACRSDICIMDGLLDRINRQVLKHVTKTPISALTPVFTRTARQKKHSAL